MLLKSLRSPALAQKLAILFLLLGLLLLLVEVRYEHQVVLGEKWQAWIPIVYTAAMFITGCVGLLLWGKVWRLILSIGFALAPLIALIGLWFHSKGDPWMAICMVFKVICMMPGKVATDAGGPPFLAPLALAGLGMLGLLICQIDLTGDGAAND